MAESVESLSSDLLRDFYQTFRLSQGNAALQVELFPLLSMQYHSQVSTMAMLPQASELACKKVVNLILPSNHSTSDITHWMVKNEFTEKWQEYTPIILGEKQGPPFEKKNLIAQMLAMDLKYQEEARPNRSHAQDPHESLVREYILGDKLTGSVALMTIQSEFAQHLRDLTGDENTGLSFALRRTTKSWETNHPGQVFIQPAATKK